MKLWDIAFSKIITPVFGVCLGLFLVIYLLSLVFSKLNITGKAASVFVKISKILLKVFATADKLISKKVILIGAVVLEVIALFSAIFSGSLFSNGANIFVLTILGMVLIAVAWVAGLFMIKLAMKGLSVALGKAMENFGDHEAYVDAVRDVGGKFVVFEDEDPNQYPEDMVTFQSGTRAEADAKQREIDEERWKEHKAERKAHEKYLQAERRYDHAAAMYRQSLASGDKQSAERYKCEMEKSLVDMKNSGYSR